MALPGLSPAEPVVTDALPGVCAAATVSVDTTLGPSVERIAGEDTFAEVADTGRVLDVPAVPVLLAVRGELAGSHRELGVARGALDSGHGQETEEGGDCKEHLE